MHAVLYCFGKLDPLTFELTLLDQKIRQEVVALFTIKRARPRESQSQHQVLEDRVITSNYLITYYLLLSS